MLPGGGDQFSELKLLNERQELLADGVALGKAVG